MIKFDDRIHEIQELLAKQEVSGWLLYDYKKSNPLAHAFLQIPSGQMVTRRFFYWIPRKGIPVKIVPMIEPSILDHLPGNKLVYCGWQELERLLCMFVEEGAKIAMEYSPYNALPNVSKVDAGTIEFLRQHGAEIVSSANLLQRYTSVWTPAQLEAHLEAAEVLDNVAAETWAYIQKALLTQTPLTEYQVQQYILERISAHGCIMEASPICAVNQNSANPHYAPSESHSAPINSGDFILIDLWCKKNIPDAVYADITRVGVAAPQPTARQKKIFEIVKEARDEATRFIKECHAMGRAVQGWQVDQAARDVIIQAGFGEYFIHRTGHNISEEVHGAGTNLDNLETHDYRELLPGTCCSIEPGIYLPQDFGVRLEYDIYLGFKGECHVTGGVQNEVVCLG